MILAVMTTWALRVDFLLKLLIGELFLNGFFNEVFGIMLRHWAAA